MPRSLANCYEILVAPSRSLAEPMAGAGRASGLRATSSRELSSARIETVFAAGPARIRRGVHRREQPARHRHRRAVSDLRCHAQSAFSTTPSTPTTARVRELIQVLRLTPRDHDGQHLRSWRIEPSADGRLRRSEDCFGNLVHTFSRRRAGRGTDRPGHRRSRDVRHARHRPRHGRAAARSFLSARVPASPTPIRIARLRHRGRGRPSRRSPRRPAPPPRRDPRGGRLMPGPRPERRRARPKRSRGAAASART